VEVGNPLIFHSLAHEIYLYLLLMGPGSGLEVEEHVGKEDDEVVPEFELENTEELESKRHDDSGV